LEESRPRFIADENVGKLARWLRLLGFDTLYFKGDDGQMVEIALEQKRIIITRDTHVVERKPIASGKVKALLLKSDSTFEQVRIIITEQDLRASMLPFTLCLECNRSLVSLDREAVKERVPPYVWQTRFEYVECPACRRVYWKGSHWTAMKDRLVKINIM
jgi:uncharacterized protein